MVFRHHAMTWKLYSCEVTIILFHVYKQDNLYMRTAKENENVDVARMSKTENEQILWIS
jgi:hypothetical protein